MAFLDRLFGRLRRSRRTGTILTCSFCGADQATARKIVAGPAVYVCDRCVDLALRALADGTAQDDGRTRLEVVAADDPSRCQFCGKAGRPLARRAGTGDDARICDECLALCTEIIQEELAGPAQGG